MPRTKMSKKAKVLPHEPALGKALRPIMSLFIEFINWSEICNLYGVCRSMHQLVQKFEQDRVTLELILIDEEIDEENGFQQILNCLLIYPQLPVEIQKRWLRIYHMGLRTTVADVDVLEMIDWYMDTPSLTIKNEGHRCALCNQELVPRKKTGSVTWRSYTHRARTPHREGFFTCFGCECDREWVDMSVAHNFFGLATDQLLAIPRLGANITKAEAFHYFGPRFLIRDLVAMVKYNEKIH
jgi:hypothetical protein